MSIITTWDNVRPMQLLGMAQSTAAVIATGLVEDAGPEVCVCDGCEFEEVQYVSSDSDWLHNDKKSFIRSKVFASDTIVFTLLKNGAQVAVLNSSTYGDYYDFGDLPNADYKGIVVDWYLVKQAFGYGRYTVLITHTSLGTAYEFTSWKFLVVEYNAERANGSIRIETYQSGVIMSGFDYTGLGWYQSLRIQGKFGNKTPTAEIDNYQNVKREVMQISTKIDNTYTLNTELLPSHISDYLNEDALLANIIQVTDYNTYNQKLYRRFEITLSNIVNVVNHTDSVKSNYVYEFKQKLDNVIKRNVQGDYSFLPSQQVATKFIEDMSSLIRWYWDAGETDTTEAEIDAYSAGTFTGQAYDGSSGTITYSLNGGGFIAFSPTLVLVVGDTIIWRRTVGTSIGYVELVGEHA